MSMAAPVPTAAAAAAAAIAAAFPALCPALAALPKPQGKTLSYGTAGQSGGQWGGGF